jgi:ubiquitin-conjugating enzyme E2 O
MYNEMVVLKLVQSMTKLIVSPPEVFKDQIHEHFRKNGEKFYRRIKSWMELSSEKETDKVHGELTANEKFPFHEQTFVSYRTEKVEKPEFPLIPASKGFCLTLVSFLEGFHNKLKEINAVS